MTVVCGTWVSTCHPASLDGEHAYHLCVRSSNRDGLAASLRDRGIETGVHYTALPSALTAS